AGQDRVERDALLPFELLQRLDQCLVHRLPPFAFYFGTAPHSNTVRATVMSSNDTVRSPASVAIRTSRAPVPTMVPVMLRAPSTGRAVFTFTFSPTRRAKSSGRLSGRSTPGELTSNVYGPGSNPSRSSRRLIRPAAPSVASM